MNTHRHTLVSALGFIASYAVPAGLAILLIPRTLANLGDENYGLLAIFLLLIGYSGIFDAGLLRSLVFNLSEAKKRNHIRRYMAFITVAARAYFLIGIGFLFLLFLFFLLAQTALKALDFKYSAFAPFLLVGLAVPFVLLQGVYSSIFESLQRYRLLMLIKLLTSASTYLTPYFVSTVSSNLSLLAGSLVITRMVLAFIAFYFATRRIKLEFKGGARSDFPSHWKIYLLRLFKFGGWAAVSNILGPILNRSEIILIGLQVSASSVALYAASKDLILKLGVIPSAIGIVAFPKMIQEAGLSQRTTASTYAFSLLLMLTFMSPFVLIGVCYGEQLMEYWLAERYEPIVGVLTVIFVLGQFIHSLGQPAFLYIQASGRPQVTATIHICELAIFIVSMPFLIRTFGVHGAAVGWLGRIVLSVASLHIVVLFLRRFQRLAAKAREISH